MPSLFKKKENTRFPTKTTINFIADKEEKTNRIAILLFCVFLVCLGFFVKYAVLDPLQRVKSDRSHVVL